MIEKHRAVFCSRDFLACAHIEKARILDTVMMGNEALWSAMQEKERLYEVEMTDDIGMRLAELEGVVGEEDGYTAEPRAAALLEGLGIATETPASGA